MRLDRLTISAAAAILLLGAAASAEDVNFSASIDKTEADLGDQVKLVLTVSGDLAGTQLPSFEFPEGIAVVARSQATNFSVHDGVMDRSLNLVYILIPQRAGTFQLGPFIVNREGTEYTTEPITLTVKAGAVPEDLKKPSPEGRYTL